MGRLTLQDPAAGHVNAVVSRDRFGRPWTPARRRCCVHGNRGLALSRARGLPAAAVAGLFPGRGAIAVGRSAALLGHPTLPLPDLPPKPRPVPGSAVSYGRTVSPGPDGAPRYSGCGRAGAVQGSPWAWTWSSPGVAEAGAGCIQSFRRERHLHVDGRGGGQDARVRTIG